MADQQSNELARLLKHLSDMKNRQPSAQTDALVREICSVAKSFADTLTPLVKTAVDCYEREGKAFFQRIVEGVHYWKTNVPHWQETTIVLSDENWFLSPYLGLNDMIELVDSAYQNPQKANGLLVSYYSQNLDEIVSEIYSDFPYRAQIIKDAVEAHCAKKYNLSIPIFLAQADGFCYDVNRSLFDGKGNDIHAVKKSPNKRLHIKNDVNKLMDDRKAVGFDSLLLPALGKFPNIALGEKERLDRQYTGLNRNTVLHGEDTQYGTYENSLKAFSFMAYIAGIVHSYKDEMDKVQPTCSSAITRY